MTTEEPVNGVAPPVSLMFYFHPYLTVHLRFSEFEKVNNKTTDDCISF